MVRRRGTSDLDLSGTRATDICYIAMDNNRLFCLEKKVELIPEIIKLERDALESLHLDPLTANAARKRLKSRCYTLKRPRSPLVIL